MRKATVISRRQFVGSAISAAAVSSLPNTGLFASVTGGEGGCKVASAVRTCPLTFIPYYAWSNRAQTPMQIWTPYLKA